MFTPNRDQVRDFFMSIWQKHQDKSVLTPLESIALKWVLEHPEYHPILSSPSSKHYDFSIQEGQVNPFLHLSMHLAIEEQLSINNPPCIKEVYDYLSQKTDPHQAVHDMMDCLGQVIWESQRSGKPLDHELYVELLKKRINHH